MRTVKTNSNVRRVFDNASSFFKYVRDHDLYFTYRSEKYPPVCGDGGSWTGNIDCNATGIIVDGRVISVKF